jgi:hypothetical protein
MLIHFIVLILTTKVTKLLSVPTGKRLSDKKTNPGCEICAAGIGAAPRSGAPRATRSIADSPQAAQKKMILDTGRWQIATNDILSTSTR